MMSSLPKACSWEAVQVNRDYTIDPQSLPYAAENRHRQGIATARSQLGIRRYSVVLPVIAAERDAPVRAANRLHYTIPLSVWRVVEAVRLVFEAFILVVPGEIHIGQADQANHAKAIPFVGYVLIEGF